jgi:ABC-type multidrug transport system ATPase subunit
MGEQKLIAFARALLCDPSLMFLDEFIESLDENAARRLVNIVRRQQSKGISILFVCHDMRIIKDLADYIAVIVDGRMTLFTTKKQVEYDEELSNYLSMGMA